MSEVGGQPPRDGAGIDPAPSLSPPGLNDNERHGDINATVVPEQRPRREMWPGPRYAMVGYEGPLPPPQLIEDYEHILPGAAERIFQRFEKQSDHRMSMEKTALGSDVFNSRAGVACATLVSLAFLGVGFQLVRTGHDWAGTAIATIDIVGLVTAFVVGTNSRRGERVQKQRMVLDQEEDQIKSSE